MALLMAPTTDARTACALCAHPLDDRADAIQLRDLSFHAACAPKCESCGRSFRPELEHDWTYRVLVQWSVYGYEQVPFRHVCTGCRESTLIYEPVAQD